MKRIALALLLLSTTGCVTAYDTGYGYNNGAYYPDNTAYSYGYAPYYGSTTYIDVRNDSRRYNRPAPRPREDNRNWDRDHDHDHNRNWRDTPHDNRHHH